ncbi:MAG TPA: hypothetical protein PLI77_09795 [Bacteroidales bacterium]|nr:hypothetical protein [Bacteroidales bacterium]HRW34369.1 hypothetical protein [Thermotogota bacterium]
MNIKGFIFLICTIFILVFSINYMVNTNHFLLTRKTNGSFSGGLYIKDNFVVLEDTKIYVQAFYDVQNEQIEVWIEGQDGIVYQLEDQSQKELVQIPLSKGMYSFIIKGESTTETRVNSLIGYYSDEITFIDPQNQEEG